MIFGKSKREKQLERQLFMLQLEISAISAKWNGLVERINRLGGEAFLKRGEAQVAGAQFDKDDIRRLLQLCHPDKHNGSQLAVTMTQKLLKVKQ